jgi:hypothetical protein
MSEMLKNWMQIAMDQRKALAAKDAELALRENELIATRELIGGYVDRIEALEAWKEITINAYPELSILAEVPK